MIAYLLKFVLCSALLLAFYHLILGRERLFRFNRFFLLGIVFVSLAVPFTIVKTRVVEIPAATAAEFAAIPHQFEFPELTEQLAIPERNKTISAENLALTVYTLVSIFLLFRFLGNIRYITLLKRGHQLVTVEGIKMVLRSDISSSFSFLSYMYTNKERFEQGHLPSEIIEHEKSHIDQKHSYDTIFIELAGCLLWFNPVIYFIKRAIKLNHEYLADAQVLRTVKSPKDYQRMILSYTSQNSVLNPVFASHLTFGETKNRIKIMFKTTNKGLAALKQVAAVIMILLVFFALGQERVIAQEKAEKQEAQTQDVPQVREISQNPQDLPPPPPPRMVRLSAESKVRFTDASGQMVTDTFKNLSNSQKKDFMTKKLKGDIWVPPPPAKKLTNAILSELMDDQKNDIWIDGERVDNSALKNYKPNDFHHFSKGTRREMEDGKSVIKLLATLTTMKTFEENPNAYGWWAPFQTRFMNPEERPKIVEVPKTQKKKVGSYSSVGLHILPETKVRYTNASGQIKTDLFKNLTDSQKEAFRTKKMKGEIWLRPLAKRRVTAEMMIDFQNSKKYGLWIDGKRVDNAALKNYKPKEFHRFDQSILLKNAKNYGKHTFQLNMTTIKAFENSPNRGGRWLSTENMFSQIKEKPKVKEIKVKDKAKDKEKVKDKSKGTP